MVRIYHMYGASLVAQTVKCLPQCGRPELNPWVGKIPWRKKWQHTPVFLTGESHGWRSLVGYSPRGHKESDMTERPHFLFTISYVYVCTFSCVTPWTVCSLPDSSVGFPRQEYRSELSCPSPWGSPQPRG